MEETCLIGESDMKDFTPWWESHLPSWIIIYCLEGEAELSLLFKPYVFRRGMAAIISPDMYPSFISATGGFRVFYCLLDGGFAEKVFYNLPYEFFDAMYMEPLLPPANGMGLWADMLGKVYGDKANAHRQDILADLLHALALDYFHKWDMCFGMKRLKEGNNSAESICMRFYGLVLEHCREHRDTAFYAGKLCITPCYLAMVTRQVCQETPKQAIDRQVTLEIKYLLRNTDMTAGQIAADLHFADTSYLCRFFRRHTGLSLTEYRKSCV